MKHKHKTKNKKQKKLKIFAYNQNKQKFTTKHDKKFTTKNFNCHRRPTCGSRRSNFLEVM